MTVLAPIRSLPTGHAHSRAVFTNFDLQLPFGSSINLAVHVCACVFVCECVCVSQATKNLFAVLFFELA